MRVLVLAIALVVPLAAAADVSVGVSGAEHCLDTVRRALAADYPHDDDHDDEHFCGRKPGLLWCRGDCDDRSCHNDACEGWSSSIDVEVTEAGAVRIVVDASSHDDTAREFSRQRAADLRRQAARARRVLDACLRQ